MKLKMKGKKLILLIAVLALIAIIAIFSFSSKEISFISAITKSNKDLQYYDENTVFVLFTKYLDENQSVIATTSVQTQTVDKLDYKVDIPQIDGYTPLVDKLEGVLDKEGVEYLESLDYVKVVVKDNIYNIYITITYDAAPSAYTIVYYEQNSDLNGYTEVQRETIGGSSGNYTGEIYTGDEINLTPSEKTGFDLNREKTKLSGKVEAFGKKVFEVYYDRKPYYLYTFNTGDSYYEPIIIRYGQNVDLIEEPTYSGYVFDGWKYSVSMEGEKIEKPSTMPAYNLYAEAQWIKSDTHYTLSYYTQNADDDGYTNIGTIEVAAVSGDNLKDEDQDDLKTIIENGFLTARGDTAEYYYYNEEKTKLENNNFDIVVEGKGITVVPIYFDRHVYNITLDFDDVDYDTRAEVVMNGTTYTDSYTFQARYEENLLEHWITADDFTVFPVGTTNSWIGSSTRTYYFRGWQADGNSTTYVSLRLNLTSTMIEDADSDRNIVYYAQYSTSSTSRNLLYLFESFDQESTTTSDTRVLYDGKYYEVAEEYSQKVYSSSSMSAKEIAGVTNVGQKSSNSTYQFFYDRNILKITLYNMNNVYVEKELKYGQSIEEFVNTQLNPEDFSLETPGTKDWIFEGWYQDSNYMIPMVWTNSDGSYKTMTDNLVLYAKWSAPTYTITFNTNGGTWTETDSRYVKVDDDTYTLTVTEGESLTKPANPTKIGNVASAWNYEVNSESVEYLFSDSQKVYSDVTLDLQYTANTNIPYKVRYIEAQYNDGVLIEDVSQYENIVDLAPAKEVYNNTFGSTVIEYPLDIYDKENEDNYFVVNLRSEELTLTSENIDDNVIYFLYAKNPIVPYTVYYVKYQEDSNGNPIRYDYGDIPADDVLLGKKETTVAAGYATEIAEDIDGWTINGSYSQTIKLTLKASQNTMYFYYNENITGEYLINFFFMNSDGEYSEIPNYTYTSEDAAGKILYGKDFDKFTFENGATEADYKGRNMDLDKCADAYLIVTTTSETSAMDLYFENRTDLKYTVKYQNEEGNNLLENKVVENQMYSSVVTESAPYIEGYNVLNGEKQKTITIDVDNNEIIFTYEKRNDLTYTVNYYINGTTTSVANSKTVTGQIFNSTVTEEAIDVEGCTKLTPTTETITIGVKDNVINFYYNVRTDLVYTVKYLEQGTNAELSTTKTVTNQTFKTEITEQAIEISGYDKVNPTEKSITIEVTGNEIIFYYTKRTDLNYTVKYLEKDTNAVLSNEKVVDGQTYKSEVTEEAIEISGYDKVNPTEKSITIEVTGNEIIFYYTKRTDLSYTVKYLEQDTNVELASTKVVDGQTYKSEVTEEAIEISGYDKVDLTEKTITIEVSGNEIIFYYTKRTDLSYTVKYLEKDTNAVLSNEKIVDGQTYKSEVTEEAIEISGYDKVDPTEKTITIEVTGNEIIFYYTKRVDLSYTVKYLEEGTENVLVTEKVVDGQTYKSTVVEEAIDIPGYDKVDQTEKSITIEVTGNEIIFYYTKRTDLSYIVKYLEKDTNTVLSNEKVVDGQTYKSEITEEAIEISGYDKVDPTEKTITIEVTGNEIVFYYTKKSDLSYTVKYLEQDTDVELASTKVVDGQTYKSEVPENAIEISGYDKVEPTEKTITIEVSGNEIIFYYTKRTDLSYTVKYLEKDTDVELASTKVVDGQTYKSEATEEAIDITGYTKVNSEERITIEVSGNEIIFYYKKVEGLSYTVNYYEDGTQTKVATSKTVDGKIFEDEVTENAIDVEGYNKVDPTEKTITIGVGENVINFYYTKRVDLSYTVKYLEKDTNVELSPAKVIENQTFKSQITEEAIEISGYDKVDLTEKTITIEVSGNEIIFYYTKRTDLSYTVKYLEKDTNKELATEKVVDRQTYKSEVTEDAIEISGYDKVDPTEKTITIEVSENEIIFYYTKRTDLSYTVQYLEKDTNTVLSDEKVVDGQTYKSTVTENAIEISGYDKVDSTEKSITIEVAGNEIIFYYTKRTDLNYIVKYLEKDTNTVLSDEKVVDGQTYKSTVTENAIEISGYEKVDPTECTITIEVSGNEIIFYYTKRTDLSYTVKYLEQDTNKELATEKVVDRQTYKSEVTEEAIEISGYDKVDPTEKTITIEVSGNEIIFYYTKRTDLSYTVKYLEQGTDRVLSEEKVVSGKIYKSEVTENSIDIVGFTKINTQETITIEVSGNEIIFYYKKVKGLAYTVNYLEQGTNKVVAPSKNVDGKIFEEEVTETAINVEGYDKVNPTENTIVIGVGENVINFYYTKRVDLSYTVKYLEEGSNVELSLSKTVDGKTFEEKVTETARDIEGYDKVGDTETTITMAVSGNEIIFYYAKRTDLSYTVKYLEQDSNEELLTEKVVNGKTFQETITEQSVDIAGYNKVNLEESIVIEVTGNEITFYYTKKSDIEYKVEFYYEGVLDSSKTETHQATFKQIIDSYTDNDRVGYKLDEEKNFPLQISANSEENVIQIYYVIDDEQTKEIKYTVEYYKEGTLIDIDTQINTKTVQVLDQEVLTVNKDDINIVDKYFGYRLDSTEPTVIPDEVNNGDVIKVYYVIDEANTKTLNYTVEYYKEGVLVEYDTETVSETVQILQPDTLDVRKGEINTVNKYVGYKLQETTPSEIPDKIATGETIKVYYVIDENQRKDLSYTIEYYKDGELQKDETKEVSINVQLLQPDTIPVDKAEMVLSGKYVGYKLEKTSPAEIPAIANNGDVIRIYYIKDQFNYTVEYYYDGNIDNTKTDTFTATYEDVIKEYTDKNIFGYRLEKTEGLPLEISEKSEENVIKVYYIIDDGNTKTLNYTVEYYMDGVLQEGDTQLEYKTVQVLQPDTFEVDKSKINLVDKYVGYKLEKTEPDGIPDVATTGDVYKVYYVKETFGYTVEYYYEGQLNSERTENLTALYDTIIDKYPNKDEGKYYIDYTENFPMKISENTNNNIIKIHYEKKLSTITVHYYWDGVNNTNNKGNNDKRTVGQETKENGKVSVSQDVIIKDKVDTVHTISAASDVTEKYELVSKPISEEITMTVEPQEFEYIYRLKDAKVTVNFIEVGTGKILGTKVMEGQVDDRYHAVPDSIHGFGLRYDKIPKNEVGKMTLEPITVNFYYDAAPQGTGTTQTATPAEKTEFKGNGPATGDTEIIVCMAIVVAILAINISQGKILKVNTKEKINGGKKFRKEKLVGKRHSSKVPSKVARVSRLERDYKKGATRRQRKH